MHSAEIYTLLKMNSATSRGAAWLEEGLKVMNMGAQTLLSPLYDSDVTAEGPADLDEHGLLQRLLWTQSEIVQAGLDPYKVVDVVTRRAQAHVGLRVSMKSSLAGLCVTTGRALRCDDSEVDPRVDRDVARRTGSPSALVVPLPYGDSVIGSSSVSRTAKVITSAIPS
jgi:hypothetical protein